MSGEDEAALAGLLRAGLAGDKAAYGAFLRDVAPIVRGCARRKLGQGSGVDMEDIVQETLLVIHLKRHTWRPDEPVLPWVFGIARFKMIDALRRRGRRAEVEIDGIVEKLAAPEAETVSGREIDRAVNGLPPVQRSVVASISIEGRSIGETATMFGMTEGAVRVALHRGLARIARRYGRT